MKKLAQWIATAAGLLILAAVVLWGSIMIPLAIVSLLALYMLCFAIGWTTRGLLRFCRILGSLRARRQ